MLDRPIVPSNGYVTAVADASRIRLDLWCLRLLLPEQIIK